MMVSAAVMAGIGLGGCAVGNTHSFVYRPTATQSVGLGKGVLIFEVREARPEVIDEGEPASWVGEQRSGFGIPYNVLTTNRRPFAQVVQDVLIADLGAAGFAVKVAGAEPPQLREAIARLLGGAGAERGLFVEVREFNSNTYTNIDVEWDFRVQVFGPSGSVLVEDHLAGRETLEGSVMNAPGAAKKKVPPFLNGLLRDLVIANPQVLDALTTDEAVSERNGCTVAQIVSMRDSGLTEAQIEAACERPD